MSWRALHHAFAHIAAVPMSANARLVLLALAKRHHAETGLCGPSNAQLRKDTQCSERAVRDALRELGRLELVATEERMQRDDRGIRPLPNLYHIKFGSQFEDVE